MVPFTSIARRTPCMAGERPGRAGSIVTSVGVQGRLQPDGGVPASPAGPPPPPPAPPGPDASAGPPSAGAPPEPAAVVPVVAPLVAGPVVALVDDELAVLLEPPAPVVAAPVVAGPVVPAPVSCSATPPHASSDKTEITHHARHFMAAPTIPFHSPPLDGYKKAPSSSLHTAPFGHERT